MSGRVAILQADAASLPLPDSSVDLIVTSPPYFGLRSYTDGGEHYAGQIGSEATPREYLDALLTCTREWIRVLKPEGSLFVNLGDSYYSGKGAPGKTTTDPKNAGRNARRTVRSPLDYGLDLPRKTLLGIPWRYAIGCTDELGLIQRAEIIWHKVNGLPESVTDRVRRSHEQVFHFTRQPRYYSAVDEVREATAEVGRKPKAVKAGPLIGAHGSAAHDGNGMRMAEVYNNPLGKLPGSVWEIASAPLKVPAHLGIDHFAAYPPDLVRRIVLGRSPREVCTACGQGRRPVSHQSIGPDSRGKLGNHGGARARLGHARERMMLDGQSLRTITGYACACPDSTAPARPAVVLDPFGGTGTTALVSSVLGRTGITVDRSADYSRLAAWRTADPGERARALGVAKPPRQVDGQGDLFDMEAS